MHERQPRAETWNYRSEIGMLTYVAQITHPEISYAVHLLARHVQDPQLVHEQAIKHLARYLSGCISQGLILKPKDTEHMIEAYVDADFAGLYTKHTNHDPISVASRTGYIIYFMGCPILWKSTLQTEISLSATEAEYIALSTLMRELIPLRGIIQDLSPFLNLRKENISIKTTVYEDNQSCIQLANKPQFRARTKHIAIKYHFFREHIKKSNGQMTVTYINTKHQIADILTKALPRDQFTILRKQLTGWLITL